MKICQAALHWVKTSMGVWTPSWRWRLGEYIRLSKADAQKAKKGDDSNSVVNQGQLLDDYYNKHIDEFESTEKYIDDGCTGTDTDREDFQRLLADIYAKKINCVIVKDLSRLSRNYTAAGTLIENLFVQMNVRFISLAEGVDSYKTRIAFPTFLFVMP